MSGVIEMLEGRDTIQRDLDRLEDVPGGTGGLKTGHEMTT